MSPLTTRGARELGGRDAWMDRARVVVICGVVAAHAAMAYILPTEWYYEEPGELVWVQRGVLVPFVAVWLFALAILFFVSGFLAQRTLERRAPGAFAWRRLVRLGVPLLVFLFVLDPLSEFLGKGWIDGRSFLQYLVSTDDRGFGPTWFLVALVVADLGHAAFRGAFPRRRAAARPQGIVLVVAALGIAVSSFLVRLVTPLADGGYLDLSVSTWPQSFGAYALGAWTARHGGLDAWPVVWRRRAAVAAALAFVATTTLILVAIARGDPSVILGGWRAESFGLALAEGAIVVAMPVLLLRALSRPAGPVLHGMARASYAAYVLHAPLLVATMRAFQPLPILPEIKTVPVALMGLMLSFVLAWVVTKAPRLAGRRGRRGGARSRGRSRASGAQAERLHAPR